MIDHAVNSRARSSQACQRLSQSDVDNNFYSRKFSAEGRSGSQTNQDIENEYSSQAGPDTKNGSDGADLAGQRCLEKAVESFSGIGESQGPACIVTAPEDSSAQQAQAMAASSRITAAGLSPTASAAPAASAYVSDPDFKGPGDEKPGASGDPRMYASLEISFSPSTTRNPVHYDTLAGSGASQLANPTAEQLLGPTHWM